MNASKPLTLAASILITVAGMAGIDLYAHAGLRGSPAPEMSARDPIPTLATIVVRPTPAELRAAFGPAGNPSANLRGGYDPGMPYYSFAANPARYGQE